MRHAVQVLKAGLILFLFLVCLYCSYPLQAAYSPLSPLQQTALQALLAAKHSPTGTTYEHGGMLYAQWTPQGPLYRYVEPDEHGSPTGVRVIDKTILARSDALLGSYHLHLCMPGYIHDYFSTQDVVTALLTGVPEFMLDECTGLIHEFDPAVDHIGDPGFKVFNIDDGTCTGIKRRLPPGRIIYDIHEKESQHNNPDDDRNERAKACKK
jgi:hypothetical protein